MRVSAETISTKKIAGYVMAGGASRRFGSDKALAIINGETMLARNIALVSEVTESAKVVSAAGRYAEFKFEVVEDRWPDEGPLGGIVTALRHTTATASNVEWNLVISCDMPFLTSEWLAYLCERSLHSEARVVVPRSEYGLEPLCAGWRTTALETLQGCFYGGTRKVTDAMKLLPMEVLDVQDWKRFDSAGRLFWNMNTAKDYEEALRFAKMENS
jgi:molybdopterin-guanine dinucleotide biosynthesis protein A